MCEALNLKKNDHTLGIIDNTYSDYDIIFLQEAAANLIELVQFCFMASSHLSVLGLL